MDSIVSPAGSEPAVGARLDRRTRLLAGLVVAASLAVFLPTLRNGFVWDDHSFVESGPVLQSGGLARALSTNLYANDVRLGVSGYWRPAVALSYWANARVGSGSGPLHAGNVLIHALSVGMLLLLLLRRVPGPSVAPPLLAAAWWALHPTNVEPVAWLSGRYDLLSALAALAFLILPWRAGARRAALHGAIFLFGLLCKEGFLAMLVVVAADDWAAHRPPREAWPRWVAVGVAILTWTGSRALLAIPPLGGVGLLGAPRALLAGIGVYVQLAVAPLPLTTGHPWPAGALAPLALGAVVLVGLAVLVLRARSLAPPAALFVGALLPASLAGASFGVAAERYFYLPSLGLAWLLCAGLSRLLVVSPRLWRPASLALAAVVALGAFSSARRVPEWKDDATLFASALAVDPMDPYAVLHVGLDKARQGRFDEAVTMLGAAWERNPGVGRLASALAWVHLRRGDPRAALLPARRAVETGAIAADDLWQLAVALHGTGAHAEEHEVLGRLTAGSPDYPMAALARAIARCEVDVRPGCEAGIEPFTAREGPEGADAVAALCGLAIARGQRQAALACGERLGRRAPGDPRVADFARRAAALP
jgi:hypothetical protein